MEDQPPVVGEIDDQVQDAANVAFQERLLLKRRDDRETMAFEG